MEIKLKEYILMTAAHGDTEGAFVDSFANPAKAIHQATNTDLHKWYVINKKTLKTVASYEDMV